jgi:hypothetical protein
VVARAGAAAAAASTPRSALALELTGSHARALLIERVAGRARVVAQGESLTMADGPAADAANGARAAIARVEAAGGRTLYELGGVIAPRQSDGYGVDAVSLVVDGRLQAAIVAVGDRSAAASARRALAQIDAEVGETIWLDAATEPTALAAALGLPSGGRSGTDASQARVDRTPAMVLVVGAADAAALARLGQVLRGAAPAAPAVVWAGPTAGAEVARRALGERVDFRIVDPIQPAADVERLGPTRDAATQIWRDRVERRLPGADTVARWAGRLLPRRRAEELALGFLARQADMPVWLARCDADGATVLRAEPGSQQVVGGRASAAPRPRPWVLAESAAAAGERRERFVELLRAATATMPAEMRPSAWRGAGLVIATGDLTLLGADNMVRALVDGLEPAGAVQVCVDELEGLAAIGGLAEVAPALASAALADDLLRPLGALVAPAWRARAGRTAFRLKIERGGALERWDVAGGETRRVALAEGQVASLRVERAQWWDPRRYFGGTLTLAAEGGPLGLLLDGRGRPAPGPLSLGREPIEDDAPAARLLADMVPARPIADGPVSLRRTRPVSETGRIMVGAGDAVGADELVVEAGETAADHVVVAAGSVLGVADPRPYLKRAAGSRVRAGEVLAERRAWFGLVVRQVVAPISGQLQPDLGGAGNLAIVAAAAGSGVVAHLPGTVAATLPGHGVTIETIGALVAGSVGFGPERRGTLLPFEMRLDGLVESRGQMRVRDCVAVLDVLDRGQYELLRTLGAAGAIVGSVAPGLAAELTAGPAGRASEHEASEPVELAIVATEGIGSAPLCADARALLSSRQGGLACLSPGDADDRRRWPEVILPVASGHRADQLGDLTLEVGARVRVTGDRVATGRVALVASAPELFPSGVVTRGAEVDLDSGDRVRAPLANLELIA